MNNNNFFSYWDSLWSNPMQTYNYNYLTDQQNLLTNQIKDFNAKGLDVTGLESQMNNVSANLANLDELAKFTGMDASKMSPAQAMMAQQALDANSGLTGFVNNNFGGWGNVVNGLGELANLFSGIQSFNLAKDQLALQKDAFNYNRALTTRNLNDQAKQVNDRRWDILRTRGLSESGNANAYRQQYEDRKLDENFRG